ncbi:MAG: tRNA (adenosine(37)-N6)-threonylcarbamoyltransferase complex ATPase subunit type 1 TsaE [Sphingobacteriales bacterium]|nr:tRNA (adenosine(37)-N6)-threonylcarbamoyltransferase complex ATPase subunit type 1 TsaE [Sphingobacteriales bacterium]
MVVNYSWAEIDEAAAVFLKAIEGHRVIALHGELGAGKTSFVNAVAQLLEVEDAVSSPTFSIINEYRMANGGIIYHLDLYRLKNGQEAIAAGVEDCLFCGEYCFVEWPENAISILPPSTVHCYFTVIGTDSRKLQINL